MLFSRILFYSCCLLLAFAVVIATTTTFIDAVVVRRRVVTKPPEGELELPPFVAQPFVANSVFFSWTIRLDNVTREWILSGRFNFTTSAWFGIGLQSAKRMGGPLVICNINPSTAEAHCDDYYSGQAYDTPRKTHSGRTQATDADVSDSGDGYIVFDTVVQLGNESDDQAMILRDQFSRVIFARGAWDSSNNQPMQHESDEVAAMLINFDSGEVQKFQADSRRLTYYVLAAVVPIATIVGFIDTNRHFPRAPKNLRLYLSLFGVATYFGLLIMYMALCYNDYVERVAGKAMWRAMGDGATFVLSCMILPVSKRGLFHDGFGVSHEKAIKYHAMQGFLLILLCIIHMAAWIKYYNFDWVLRWAELDRRSHLPGLLAFLTILVVVGPAVMRHKSWRTFRLTHYAVIFVYFFAVLHFPPLAYGIAPGFLLHLAATAVTRYRESKDFRHGVEAGYFDEQAGIVALDLIRCAPVRPGKYFTIRLPELNSGEMHPFSVAKMIPIGSNADPGLCQFRTSQLSTAGTNDTDDWLLHPPLSGQLTSDLVGGDSAGGLLAASTNVAAAGGQDALTLMKNNKTLTTNSGEDPTRKQQEDWCILRLMIKVSKDQNSWTYRLAQYLKQRQVQQKNWGGEMVPLPFANFRISGPYGRLEVNPAVYCQFVFVAGGVGINPLLYTLQCMSMGMIEYTGDPLGYLSINFYWVVRDESIYECYIQDLLQCKKRLEKLCPSASIYIRVMITGTDGFSNSNQSSHKSLEDRTGFVPHTPAVLEGASAKLLDRSIVTERMPGKRPDFLEVATDAMSRCRVAAADPRHVIAAEDTTPEREALLREAVAVSICGPPDMMDAVQVGFKAAEANEKNNSSTGQGNEEQPLVLHFETHSFRI